MQRAKIKIEEVITALRRFRYFDFWFLTFHLFCKMESLDRNS